MSTIAELEAQLESQRPIIEAVSALMEADLKLAVSTAVLDALENRDPYHRESDKAIANYVEAMGDQTIAMDDLRKVAGGWRG